METRMKTRKETQHWVLAGGGLDSSVLMVDLAVARPVTPIHIDYGQKAAKAEVSALAKLNMKNIDSPIQLHSDFSYSGSNIMSGGIADTQSANRLEYRNPTLLMQAASYIGSVSPEGKHILYLGFHREPKDLPFPDAGTNWLEPMQKVLDLSSEVDIRISTPYSNYPREYIYSVGRELLVHCPNLLSTIHSCYEAEPCGHCIHCKQLKQLEELALID